MFYSFIYLFIYLFVGLFICLLVCWFICLFVYLFICLFVCLFIYLFMYVCPEYPATRILILTECSTLRLLLTQELQRRMPARLLQGTPTEVSKETYLSQDVGVNLLQENKTALKRCELVSVGRISTIS
jgi:hypothetical protein